MSIFETPKQKRCGARGHGYVMLSESSVAISGCIYCGANAGKGKVVGTYSCGTVDVATRITVAICSLVLAAVGVLCVLFLSGVV